MRLFEIIGAEHALERETQRFRREAEKDETHPCSTKNGIFACVVGMFFAWNLQNSRYGSIVSIDGRSNHFRDLFTRTISIDLFLFHSHID